ncbi:MAG: hypothetical protein HY080_09565 [Gammaproteobacteria bacterium]|nr:hypothetical protein [Gammaproteobacteria bacterium]
MLRRSLVALSLVIFSNLVLALPSIHEVYTAANSGNLAQAKAMMQEVLKARPNSGQAHFVYAHILAQNAEYQAAATELKTAERLAPGLPFAKPESVDSLRGLLHKHIADPALLPALSSTSPGSTTNWTLILIVVGGVVGIILIVRALGNYKRDNPTNHLAPTINPYQPNPNPVAPPYGQAPAGSSALKTGLATGLGVAAGMVAGQAIANSLFGDHHSQAGNTPLPPTSSDDLGGKDFGLNDNSSWDDASLPSDGGDFGGGDGSGGGDWS